MKCKTSEQDATALKDCAARIETAVAALAQAEAGANRLSRLVIDGKTQLFIDLTALNPDDAEAVDKLTAQRGRLETLEAKSRCDNSLRAAVLELRAALFSAETSVKVCAQERCVEEGALASCTWVGVLNGISSSETAAQIPHLRSTATQVLVDIRQVLSCRRGMLLTIDERRDGVLNDIYRRRRLTPEEIAQGWAVE